MQGNATRIAVITRLTIVWRTRKIASHGGGREGGIPVEREGGKDREGHARLRGTIRKRANLGRVLIANMTVLNFP